jgi:Uma2 family endonuclease
VTERTHARRADASEPSRPQVRSMDVDAWSRLPEDAAGELVDGVLVEEEVPDYVHEVVVAWLCALFCAWVVPLGGFVGGSDAKFALGARHGRKPDVSVFLPGRTPPRRGPVRIPPDIAVEIVSPTPRDGRRDRVEKLREYAAFGVKFYWIVDPELRSLEVFELVRGRRYVHAVGATGGLVRRISGCSGLAVDLDALWAETDRLGSEPRPRRRSTRKRAGG